MNDGKVESQGGREEPSIIERPKALMWTGFTFSLCHPTGCVILGYTLTLFFSWLFYKMKIHYLLCLILVKIKRWKDVKALRPMAGTWQDPTDGGWIGEGGNKKAWNPGQEDLGSSFPGGDWGCWGQGRTQKKKGSYKQRWLFPVKRAVYSGLVNSCQAAWVQVPPAMWPTAIFSDSVSSSVKCSR